MAKPATVEEMLAAVRKRRAARGVEAYGLLSAADFLGGIVDCLGDPQCEARHCQIASRPQWESAVKKAEGQLVLAQDGMRVLGGLRPDPGGAKRFGHTKKVRELTPGSILDFEGVVTTSSKDRDRDILESSGAVVDPRHALLWQHIPFEPVGKHVEVVQQNRKRVISHFAMADTLLAHDAAILVEFEALRLSHGFRPLEVERLDPEDGEEDWQAGFHVKRFEIMETSLVSVPANVEAQILSQSRGKLHHPYAKAQALHLRRRLPPQVTSGWDRTPARKDCACGHLCADCRRQTLTDQDVAADPEVPLDQVFAGKPYPNEHACRINDPAKYDKFRRKNKKREDGKAYGLIFGHVPKNDAGDGDKWELQSLRFPKGDWAVAEAKKACQDAEGAFEAAQESQTDQEPKTADNGFQLVPAWSPPHVTRLGRGKSWCGIALDGSWQWIEDRLEEQAEAHLEQHGVRLGDDEDVHLVGTFPNRVVLAVVAEGEDGEDTETHFFAVGWSMLGGVPRLEGDPQEVSLSATVSDPATAPPLTPGEAAARLLARKGRPAPKRSDPPNAHPNAQGPVQDPDQAAANLIRAMQAGAGPGKGTVLALLDECAGAIRREEEAAQVAELAAWEREYQELAGLAAGE